MLLAGLGTEAPTMHATRRIRRCDGEAAYEQRTPRAIDDVRTLQAAFR